MIEAAVVLLCWPLGMPDLQYNLSSYLSSVHILHITVSASYVANTAGF